MTDTMTLAPWVETLSEISRGGRTTTIAVNRRDGAVVLLDDLEEGELHDALASGGFLAGSPPVLPAPRVRRLARFMRTFDVHWTGADRLVVAVHDRIARHLFRRAWVVAQVALALLGVVAVWAEFAAHRPLEFRPSPGHIPLYVALSLVSITIHELGHGVVLSRNHRRVQSVGFRLHLGSPAFYVESVEALLLTRPQRLLQVAAGPWAEWLFVSTTATVLWLAPTGQLTPVLHRFVVLSVFTIVSNLLPFAGLDGSLLFADLVREPNLAISSKLAAERTLTGRRQPGDRFLVAYAVLNTAVSALLFATSIGLWFALFGGLLGALFGAGPFGCVAAVALLAVAFGPSIRAVLPTLRSLVVVDRLAFRVERSTRVRLTARLARCDDHRGLDDHALSLLAGRLVVRRVTSANPVHEPGFSGIVIVEGAVELTGAATEIGPGVHRVDGGVAVAPSRRHARVRCALLPR